VPDHLQLGAADFDRVLAQIRGAGLRVTSARITLLVLAAEPGHHSVDDLGQAARVRLGSVSMQAVYDNLRALEDAGLLRRIQLAGGPARFEARVGDNHHHVICRNCGSTADVDCAVGSAPCLEASTESGFVIDEADVTYWGLCPSCQRVQATTTKKMKIISARNGDKL
jgi:Fur family ferric uptake transcriptional regulator